MPWERMRLESEEVSSSLLPKDIPGRRQKKKVKARSATLRDKQHTFDRRSTQYQESGAERRAESRLANASTSACSSQLCQNGGKCTDVEVNIPYKCACLPGFDGTNCEVNVNECDSSPCLYGGLCIDHINRFDCICPPGIEGILCELDKNECASIPCLNDGTCIDQINRYDCKCLDGFIGLRCEEKISVLLTTTPGATPELVISQAAATNGTSGKVIAGGVGSLVGSAILIGSAVTCVMNCRKLHRQGAEPDCQLIGKTIRTTCSNPCYCIKGQHQPTSSQPEAGDVVSEGGAAGSDESTQSDGIRKFMSKSVSEIVDEYEMIVFSQSNPSDK